MANCSRHFAARTAVTESRETSLPVPDRLPDRTCVELEKSVHKNHPVFKKGSILMLEGPHSLICGILVSVASCCSSHGAEPVPRALLPATWEGPSEVAVGGGSRWSCLLAQAGAPDAGGWNLSSSGWTSSPKKAPSSTSPTHSQGGSLALSLKVLQRQLRQFDDRKAAYPETLSRLAGMTWLSGCIVDQKSSDVVLFGEAVPNAPALYLEDLIVALRNSWLKFAVSRNGVLEYSDPGCSIDPDLEVVGRLQQIGQMIAAAGKRSEVEVLIREWETMAKSSQSVRVLGIPFDTRFARIMVMADYDMKAIVDGSDSVGVPGLVSVTDILIAETKRAMLAGKAASLPLNIMNRFWFYPGKTVFDDAQGVFSIAECSVALLTEEQYLKGGMKGTGRANPFAEQFAKAFTSHYDEVSKKRPVYADLDNLFRFVAICKALKHKDAFSAAGLPIDYLLTEWKIPAKYVERSLKGRYSLRQAEQRVERPDGYTIYGILMPSCGGVSIDLAVDQASFRSTHAAAVSASRAAVLAARPQPESLSWTFAVSEKSQ
jgi:hypothetical protein